MCETPLWQAFAVPEGRFVFRSEWLLPASPPQVYAVLADVESYPAWWPQVRKATRIDEASGELTCRSLLPYDLVFRMHQELRDPEGLVLRASMSGDLNGTSQWTIAADGAQRSRAVFDEDVSVGSGLVGAAGRLFRPALKFNHDLMMRSGEKGLRKHLASGA
jgi:ribosome-associated toxin RatA of RatAB toxin-antitoxin module